MQYYQPKIEEFCVGFECEMRNSSHPKYFDWEKCKFKDDFSNELSEDYCFEYLKNDLKEESIRVKVLDEQDILDCDFEYTNNNLDLIKKQDDKIIRIRYRVIEGEPHLRIYEKSNRSYKDEWMPIFIGRIKNKTAFKQLLSQLEI